MNDRICDQAGLRTCLGRAGITALNLIAPGLGLLRVGNWRAGVLLLLAPFALLAIVAFGMGNLPITRYSDAIFAIVAAFGLLVALYVVAAVLTWRQSNFHSPARWWSRWYNLIIVAIVVLFLSQLASSLGHCFYKPFYAPSESMAPTIGKGDKYIADMRWRGPFRRGEIVMFNGPGDIRISRIAAVPGDRIAMHGGVPVVNGKSAIQFPQGKVIFTGYDGLHSTAVLTERLPGEPSMHRVLDAGPSEFDDTQEVVVPPNHLFVLGDNRDRSADSRVPAELAGVGMVSETAVIARPMYIHWSSDHSKIGERLDK